MAKVLHLGWGNIGYQLGTGIHEGWNMVQHWLDRCVDIEFGESDYLCCRCGEPLLKALVPAPVWVMVWTCKNGHKFCYENTD